MRIKISIIILLISCISVVSQATNIHGKINIDDSWEPLIYLSILNSFDDLNTASYDFLVYQTGIDSTGDFQFPRLNLPKDARIYRLHICKKGDPVSTIIIGGKDENFIHFIMKNNDSITIDCTEESHLFHECKVNGHTANAELQILLQLRKDLNSPPAIPSNQNREFLRKQVFEKYKSLVDTSSFAVIRLLAMHFINSSFSEVNQLTIMKEVQENISHSDTSTPYYKAFLEELDFLSFNSQSKSNNKMYFIIALGVIIVIVGFITIYSIKREKPEGNREDKFLDLISQLSIQEKKVLDLLKEGKTNKEISQELHIEVSTVKSHLNKIYSQLGVKSRKEIVNFNW